MIITWESCYFSTMNRLMAIFLFSLTHTHTHTHTTHTHPFKPFLLKSDLCFIASKIWFSKCFCLSVFFLKIIYLFIYLFIFNLWLCWVFVSVRGPSPVAASGDHSSSLCAGLSLSRPLLLRSTGSRHAGLAIVAHGPSCSAACGILPDQGSNPCPLH